MDTERVAALGGLQGSTAAGATAAAMDAAEAGPGAGERVQILLQPNGEPVRWVHASGGCLLYNSAESAVGVRGRAGCVLAVSSHPLVCSLSQAAFIA